MRAVKYLSASIAVATFGLMLFGGVVHTQGASLACPDWPLCYGEVLPPAQAGAGGWLEQGHRFVATAVGAAIVALVLCCCRRPARPLLGRAGVGLGLVLLQGGWGALTVVWRLPPWVSVAHLATAMLLFAWAAAMVLWTWAPPATVATTAAAPRAPVALAAAAVYLQMLLGASVRHSQSSMACGDGWWTCLGRLWPQDGRQALHLSHRYGALVVGFIVIAGTVPALRWARRAGRRLPYLLALGAHLCVLSQWAVGLYVVRTHVHLHVVTAHLGLAALLWGALVGCFVALGPAAATGARQAGAGLGGGLRRPMVAASSPASS